MGCLVEETPKRSLLPAAIPEWCVEVLFPFGATAADGDWTDITPRVQSVTINNGRSRELDQFQEAEADVQLWSKDRLFDPDNTAGPYYPWLRSLRQIRISAVWAGVRYPMFRGHIDTWPQTSIEDYDGIVTVKAFDAFKYFSRITLPGSMYEMIELTDNPPDHWWPFDDPADSTVVLDHGTLAPVNGTVRQATLGNTTILPFDGGRTCAGFTIAAGQTGIQFGYTVTPSSGMVVNVDPGTALFSSTSILYAGGTLTIDPADSAFGTSRFDLIVANSDGTVSVVDGVPQIFFPAVPAAPSGSLPIAHVFVGPGVTTITAAVITDDREIFNQIAGADIVFPTAPWPQSLTAWTVGIWFAANPVGAATSEILTFGGSGGLITGSLIIELGFGLSLGLLSIGYFGVAFDASTSWQSTARYDDGLIHSVWVTLSTDAKIRIYVDGSVVQTSNDQTGNLAPFGKDAYSVGSYWNAGLGFGQNYFSGSMANLTTRDGAALTDTQVRTRHLAGLSGLAGEDTGTQIGRLLDFAGWPA